jgi:hypothetical protein
MTKEPPRWWDLPLDAPREDVIRAALNYDIWRIGESWKLKRQFEEIQRRRRLPHPYLIDPLTGERKPGTP